MSQLTEYIRNQLANGYDKSSIRNFLINQGYNLKDIDDAFDEIYKGEKLPNTKIKFFFVIFFICIIIFILLLVFQLTKNRGPVFSVDLQIGDKDHNFFNNESLLFNVNITSKKNRDMNLMYEITKLGVEKVIMSKEDVLKVNKGKINIVQESFNLNKLSSGTYRLKVIASSNGLKRLDYSSFIIKEKLTDRGREIEEEKSEDNITLQQEQLNTSSNKTTSTKIPERDNQTKEMSIQEIIDLGLTDEKKAEELCISIESKDKSEECLTLLAQKTKNSDICLGIDTTIIKDGCFANLALEGDFSLCEKINDQYQREACIAIGINQQFGEE